MNRKWIKVIDYATHNIRLGRVNVEFSEPNQNNKKEKITVEAVRKETNQKILADIAQNDTDFVFRMLAVEKLTDQTLLAD